MLISAFPLPSPDTVPQEDGLLLSAERSFSGEERLEPLVAEACTTKAAKEQLEVRTPVEKDGSGAVSMGYLSKY